MGDKSPKSQKKHAGQKAIKANSVQAKKDAVIEAKKSANKK